MARKNSLIILSALLLIFCCQKEWAFPEIKGQRIISLAPSTTEILFALGLDDEIVGVSTFCNYPPKALNKEKAGTFSQPDIEKILLLKPDIILATGLEQAATVERLRHLGLDVYISDPSDIKELFDSITEIGKLTHREKEAMDLIAKMKTKINQVRSKAKNITLDKSPKVFIEIWYDPLTTAGKGSFVDELIGLAGGVNIAHDVPRPYSHFSPEQVIKRNPDFIILAYMSEIVATDMVRKRLGWKEINAVKYNRIYNDINADLFLRPGPRVVEGLEEIQKRIFNK